jgi:hypothetical protein
VLTPQESAAAAATGQITLEFGPAVDSDRRLALCHLDMFGQTADVVAGRAKQQQQQEQEELVSMWCGVVWCGRLARSIVVKLCTASCSLQQL